MPYFRNNNDHGVRVGASRIPPEAVGEVSDEDAKVYGTYTGVEKANKADYEEYREQEQLGGGSPTRDRLERLKLLRQQHRAESVAAPLQVVVGDDDAPYGPPTGTITTKQAVAQKSAEDKRQFADHEQAEVPEGASEVEQAQAENTRVVEEVAQALAEERDRSKVNQEDSSSEE